MRILEWIVFKPFLPECFYYTGFECRHKKNKNGKCIYKDCPLKTVE